jgi:hypothetical protein
MELSPPSWATYCAATKKTESFISLSPEPDISCPKEVEKCHMPRYTIFTKTKVNHGWIGTSGVLNFLKYNVATKKLYKFLYCGFKK